MVYTLIDHRNDVIKCSKLKWNHESLFVGEQKTSMLSQFLTKHASSSPVMFVILKRFAVLFFLPSCSIKSLLCRDLEVGKDSVR